MNAINALSPGAGGTLVATDGSTTRPTGQWVHDLMERGRTGRVLVLDIASGRVRTIASGLHYAFGACATGDAVFVSESWQHRVIAIAPDGSRRAILDNLPVYPSRLAPAGIGAASADGVRGPHPARRVRTARECLPGRTTGGNRSGILDRSETEIRPVVSRTDAGRPTSRPWASSNHGRRRAPTASSSG